jgi:hypothetical protein
VTKGIVLAERGLAGITDALVAVSPAVHDQLLGLGIGTPSKWHVIPLGLDLEPLRTSTGHRPQARTALGGGGDRRAGSPGRRLRRGRRRARADPRRGGRAKHLVGDRVVFLGWVHDLPRLYAALDAVVLTSRNEGTPVALIEAMAAGRPVVATRVGGVSDVIEDGRTGLVAPAADAAAVAASISSILEAPNLARNLARRGREASARFGLDRLADDLTDLDDELLERAGRPGRSPG